MKKDHVGPIFSFQVHVAIPKATGGQTTLLCTGCKGLRWAAKGWGPPSFRGWCLDLTWPQTSPPPRPGCWVGPSCSLSALIPQGTMGAPAGAPQPLCKGANQKVSLAHEKAPWALLTCSRSADPGGVDRTPSPVPRSQAAEKADLLSPCS